MLRIERRFARRRSAIAALAAWLALVTFGFGLVLAPEPLAAGTGGSDLELESDASAKSFSHCPRSQQVCTWERVVGGRLQDKVYAVAEMRDGGFTFAGHTRSHGRMRYDAWVVRVDRAGRVRWQLRLGGRQTEQIYAAVAMQDGGVAIAGHTRSRGAGESDAWVVRLSEDGAVVWEKTFGGPANDRAKALALTEDGGLLVAGFTRSKGAGDGDAWLLRLDAYGEVEWETVHGQKGDDGAVKVTRMPGGGYAVAGYSQGFLSTAYDFWVLWVDDRGWVRWERRFRKGMFGAATSLTPSRDGGLYVVGMSHEASDKRPNVWMMHLDRHGALIWQKLVGGAKSDGAWGIAGTADGGFVVLAATQSRGAGSTDAWLMRFDALGKLVWERLYGRKLWDRPTSILATHDGGLMVTGYTTSRGAGYEDAWLLRLDENGELDAAGRLERVVPKARPGIKTWP